ncbi:hypothetical protein C9374_002239 [Naegleria lovaniensis]|uniref:Microbial-type PARG catalytic domain-containing protein n=1 Tax=Naegleria lovaniensis TaxID=51637 RepID=A0AA88GPE2_NAELO|nr:uncharacterized protein C9374_002239 [Naegleria lovaniensis]KAG2386495.1 hypothetical protein C9374_002239 [Naegleria lovaniensis]
MGRRELYRNKPSLHNAAPLAAAHSQPLGITIGARTTALKPPKYYIPREYYERVLKYMKTKEHTSELAGVLTKFLFSAKDWKYFYFDHRWKEYANVRRALRKLVQMGTLQTLLRGKYFVEEDGEEYFAKSVQEETNKNTTVVESSSQQQKNSEVVEREEQVKLEAENELDQKQQNTSKSKKKKEKRRKKKQQEEDLDLDDDDDNGDDGTFDGFEIQREEDKEPLYELNEWKEDKKQKKKNAKKGNKHSKKQIEEEEPATEDQLLNEDNFKEELGIPVRTVHIDFNSIKKTCSQTEKIDCAEYDSVVQITSSGAKKPSKHHHNKDLEESSSLHHTIIQVVEGDVLSTAILLKRAKLNPIILISGSQTSPAGSYSKGGNTQEEDVCRRSALALALADPYRFDENRNWTYPLPEFGGVYVPHCLVIRQPKSEGYAFCKHPTTIGMMVMYPYINPPTEKRKVADPTTVVTESDESDEDMQYELFVTSKLANSIKKKIAAYFEVALRKGHDALVLGSFGCDNTHSNPAYHIASLFKEVLSSDIFKDKFKAVIFSIAQDNESDSKLKNDSDETLDEESEESSDRQAVDEEELTEDLEVSSSVEPSTNTPKKNNLSIFSKVFHGKEDAPTAEHFISTMPSAVTL